MLFKRSVIIGKLFFKMQNFSRQFNTLKSVQSLKKIKTPYKFMLLASATAIGISAYVVHKNKINCDIIEDNVIKIIETEKLIDDKKKHKFNDAINKSREILDRLKDEIGAPGIIVGVSVDGETVWTEGLGYADIENRVLCSTDTVMRIASISKSITMAAVAKLIEQGKLDLDKPIQEYVPHFPQKTFEEKPVVITCRHLVSHLAGIRHYTKPTTQNGAKNNGENGSTRTEFEHREYFIKDKHDVKSSLNLFKDDPLIAKPGTKFYYTTHGWTLVSAIVEAVVKEDFPRHMKKLFKTLGMRNTYLDENDNIIYNRSRNYRKNKTGFIINAPYVDNSYKWAGGGFLSNITDLLHFANAMLYSYQHKGNGQPGFLSSKMMETMWTPVTSCNDHYKYAMGWFTCPEKHDCQFCEKVKFSVFHTGGAIGASSILFIMPKSTSTKTSSKIDALPQGVIVAILTNLMPVNLTTTALKIAELFDNL